MPKTERLVENVETGKPARQRETEDHRPEGLRSGVEGFNDRARRAVADEQLHDSIELFTHKSVTGRNAVLDALPEAPELRERAYRTKQETMANLDRYLEQMADSVEARGGNVFFAGDGEDVVRYIGDLARLKGAKVITKSKSMATEEIELNRRLEEDYADIGVTGANFGVAETGTICTVTNEGNARLVTSIPPVHVVVMGIEKVIPKFEDLSTFVQLLARSGTGQKITVYTNFITGPRAEGELDGAEEFHLVLMDNGRSRLLGTEFEEALYCIRCGACLNVCPVYRQTGGHAYGSTYSGPIGAVITPILKGDENAKDLPHASSLCGACWEACPVGIPLHDLLLKLRNRQVQEGVRGTGETLAFKGFENTMRSPALFKISGKVGRVAQKPLVRDDSVRPLPGPLSAWTNSRELPPLAEKTFREIWKEGI